MVQPDCTAVSQRCHGKPKEWQWVSLDSHNKPNGYIEVYGAIPIGIVARGKRKGKPKFGPKKNWDQIWMRKEDVQATKRLWESDTGKCWKCQGGGRQTVGYRTGVGPITITCERCGGSGDATANRKPGKIDQVVR